MTGIWILGGGGHAKVALATLAADGKAIAGLYDDDPAKQGLRLLGHEIIGVTPPEDWWNSETRSAFIAIGSNKIRERVAARRANWAVARHPAAHVHATVALAAGTLVCAGVVIQPDTCLGAHAIANTACVGSVFNCFYSAFSLIIFNNNFDFYFRDKIHNIFSTAV